MLAAICTREAVYTVRSYAVAAAAAAVGRCCSGAVAVDLMTVGAA